MSKIFAKYFPLFDHLYIFQLYEYNFWDFLIWFAQNPFKRNLQKKHRLKITSKAFFFMVVSFLWTIFFLLITWHLLFKGFYVIFIPFAWVLLIQLSPLSILPSFLISSPIDYYLKTKIIKKTSEKLANLKNIKIVTITGSYGKTSTKDILYTLLWKKFRVVKTAKSFNTPLGIAQTILEDVKNNTDVLISEIGAYKKGEIKNMAKLIKPDIGIITAIGPQHLSRFGTLENITRAKFELVENLPKNGLAILNSELTSSATFKNLSLHPKGVNLAFFGNENHKNSYKATAIKALADGTFFILHTPKGQISIQIPLLGNHHIQNFLAAAAAAMQLGLSLKEIQERAKLLLPTPNRMEIKQLGSITLIDNSFNTNPVSAKASLELLNSFQGRRKIIITPGFVELGRDSAKENRAFAERFGSVSDKVVIVGENAKKDLLSGLKSIKFPKEDIHFTRDTKEALTLIQQISDNLNTVVLLENDLPDQYF